MTKMLKSTFAQLLTGSSVTSISLLLDQDCEVVSGGARPSFGSLVGVLGSGNGSGSGNSFFNQISTGGGSNITNVGNTGQSIVSIGAIYL
jgi:hypothetical protein